MTLRCANPARQEAWFRLTLAPWHGPTPPEPTHAAHASPLAKAGTSVRVSRWGWTQVMQLLEGSTTALCCVVEGSWRVAVESSDNVLWQPVKGRVARSGLFFCNADGPWSRPESPQLLRLKIPLVDDPRLPHLNAFVFESRADCQRAAAMLRL